MKIIINSIALKKAIGKVNGIISNQYYIVPVCENFKFDLTNKTLSATDISNYVTFGLGDVTTEGQGEFLIPKDVLTKFISLLPDCPVTLDHNSTTYNTIITTDLGDKLELSGEAVEDYPRIPVLEDEKQELVLNLSDFKEALDKSAPFVTPDGVTVVSALNIESNGEKLTLGAVFNNHVLSVQKMEVKGEKFNINVYPILQKVISQIDTEEELKIIIYKTKYEIVTPFICFFGSLWDDVFPPYEKVLPYNNHKVVFNRKEIVNVLKKALLTANVSIKQGVFTFKENSILIESFDYDFKRSYESIIPCENPDGHTLKIGFSMDLLLKVLNTMETENVEAYLGDQNNIAIVIKEQAFSTYMVMPSIISAPALEEV